MDAMTNLFEHCAPALDVRLTTSLVKQESGFKQFAIGLDAKDGTIAPLRPQPKNMEEAVSTAMRLTRANQKFSVGLAQIHVSNVKNYGLSWEQAFDACTNLRTGQQVLMDFHRRALKAGFRQEDAVYAALRGYNSGDIRAGVSNGYARDILTRVVGRNFTPSAFVVANTKASKYSAPLRTVPYQSTSATTTQLAGAASRFPGESRDIFDK